MKIGVICFWDKIATPYIDKYEAELKTSQVEYKIIYWNRNGVAKNDNDSNCIFINLKVHRRKIFKIIDFFRWKFKLLKILKKENFDRIIVLTTVPAVLLKKYLIKKYKNKYLFDIRDYTLEKNKIFRMIVEKLISNSKLTTISSEGFMKWLSPSEKIIINHNITNKEIVSVSLPNLKKDSINIGFVGNVRFDKQTKLAILQLENSKKFNLSFFGRVLPNSDVFPFVASNNIRKIHFHGEFSKNDKPNIYRKIDIINAIYANTNDVNNFGDSTPLPNRIYDCVVFRRPIISSKNTYLADIIDFYHLGLSVNAFDDDIEKELNKYIDGFDIDLFIKGCDKFLEKIMKEENVFLEELREFLKD